MQPLIDKTLEKYIEKLRNLQERLKDKSKDPTYPRHELVEIAYAIETIYESLDLNQFYFYEPLPKLKSFHESYKRERLIIGGNRSGKTHAGCWEVLACALNFNKYKNIFKDWKGSKKKVGWIVSISNEVQRDIVQDKLQLLMPPNEVSHIVKRDSGRDFWDIIYFKNGNELHFKTAEQNRRKFQGASIDFCWIDEEIPEDIFNEVKMRLLDKNGYLWITLTPLEGYSYIEDYREKVERYPDKIGIWELDTRENYYLNEETIDRITFGMTEEEKLIRLTGSGNKESERVYPPLARSDFYIPRKDIYINPDTDVTIAGLDLGVNDPTAMLVAKIDNLNNVIIFDEYYETGKLIPQAGREIGMKLKPLKNFLYLVIDVSVLRRDPITGKSYLEILRQALGEVGITNINILMSGKEKSIFTGISIVHQYLDNTLRHRGREMLLVSDKCQKLLWEARRYKWKDIGKAKGSADHLLDALRYMLERRPKPYMEDYVKREIINDKPRAFWRRNRSTIKKHIRRHPNRSRY